MWYMGPLYTAAINFALGDKDIKDIEANDLKNLVNAGSVIERITTGGDAFTYASDILAEYDFEKQPSPDEIIVKHYGYKKMEGRADQFVGFIEQCNDVTLSKFVPDNEKFADIFEEETSSSRTVKGPVEIFNDYGGVKIIVDFYGSYDRFLYYKILEIPDSHEKNRKEELTFEEEQQIIRDVVREKFWAGDVCLLEENQSNNISADAQFTWLDPNNIEYFGDLREYDDMLDKFLEDDHKRSFLLQGPPGTGKTTYCLNVTERLSDRAMIVSATTFSDINQGVWQYIMNVLKPEIVILNDVDRIGEMKSGQVLDFLDDNYCDIPLVLITTNDLEQMTDAFFRPGRVDYIVEIEKSSEEVRRQAYKKIANINGCHIYNEGLFDVLVQLDETFTTSHVTELFKRIDILGLEDERVTHFYNLDKQETEKIQRELIKEQDIRDFSGLMQ